MMRCSPAQKHTFDAEVVWPPAAAIDVFGPTGRSCPQARVQVTPNMISNKIAIFPSSCNRLTGLDQLQKNIKHPILFTTPTLSPISCPFSHVTNIHHVRQAQRLNRTTADQQRVIRAQRSEKKFILESGRLFTAVQRCVYKGKESPW